MGKKMDEEQRKKWIAAVLVAVFVVLINFAPKMVYFNKTRSLPLGLYVVIPGKNYRHGDIVVYRITEDVRQMMVERGYGSGDETFLKHIGGLPGDRYCVFDEVILVNGEKRGDIQRYDRQGNPMPVMDGVHFVEAGHFLPLGEKTNSLDGRYTGTVPMENIVTRVVPFITEW